MSKIALGIFIILVFLGGVFWWGNFGIKNESIVSVTPQVIQNLVPSPTPFPFEELTIPYLRAKEYKSNLGALQQVSQNQNYTSYLTSYTSDGLKINGLLTKPTGEKPKEGFPAIVFIHGYIPPTQYRTLEKYVDHVDYLGSQGFVVFKIDLRGHGDSEGEPGGGYYSSDYVIDALNARSALQASDFVNPQKIGFWGHSMAGNVALRSITAKTDIPAVVIWAGAGFTYLDLSEYRISDSSYQAPPQNTQRVRKRQQLRELYGDPKDGNPFWKLVAPTDYLKDIKGASNKTKELLLGKQVILEKDVSDTDKYKRLLRYVYLPLDGGQALFVNDYLVREGYARAYTYPPDVKFNEQFIEAERQAREGKKGLWSKC